MYIHDHVIVTKFRPIIDTTGTAHYSVGKFISELLQPLTLNKFTLKDTFDAANRIQAISPTLFAEGYEFVSFDVESLFTNVPLQRTLKIIIDRIYNKTLVKTKLKKSTLPKLIRDTCTKTVFSCNNQLYEQTDGVSMGGSLGPVLANIIMTEFEHEIINNLINQGLIAFYCRYVDDTLLLIKRNTITTILEHFHKFDRNIRFTFDLFENSTPHFLDINIASDGLGIYRKDTFTGQYTNFDSFVPWRHKISWVRALIDRIHRICTPNKIKTELKLIRKFLLWNGFPKRVANLLIDRFTTNAQKRASDHLANDTSHNNQHPTIWLTIPFVGDLTTQLVKKLKRKLRRCLVDPNVDIRIKEKTTKLCFFTSTKDKTPQLSQSNVVYEFICPGCNSSYIGKTNRTLLVRTQEHALTDKESAIYKHLRDCDNIKHIQDLYNLPDIFTNENISSTTVINKEFFAQTVRDNTNIIDRDDNWNLLLYKEAYHIKRLTPFLNNGLKASRELRLFS